MENNQVNIKDLQKAEALVRMKALNIYGQVRNALRQSGRVYYSERQNKYFDGILYYLENQPLFVGIAKRFEERTGAYVYHAQLTHTYDGDMLSLLYVSPNQSEWQKERQDLANGEATAFCVMYNPNPNGHEEDDESIDSYGESGYIGIKPINGGITRTW